MKRCDSGGDLLVRSLGQRDCGGEQDNSGGVEQLGNQCRHPRIYHTADEVLDSAIAMFNVMRLVIGIFSRWFYQGRGWMSMLAAEVRAVYNYRFTDFRNATRREHDGIASRRQCHSRKGNTSLRSL